MAHFPRIFAFFEKHHLLQSFFKCGSKSGT